MFSYGEQLYRLTERDRLTLLVEPFFRYQIGDVAGAALGATYNVDWPADRCLFLKRVVASCAAPPGAFNWSGFTVGVGSAVVGGTQHLIYARGSSSATAPAMPGDDMTAVPAVTQPVTVSTPNLDLVLPPNVNRLGLTLYRNGGVATAAAAFYIFGYLIPPGQIGRQQII